MDNATIGFCYADVMQLMILLELKWTWVDRSASESAHRITFSGPTETRGAYTRIKRSDHDCWLEDLWVDNPPWLLIVLWSIDRRWKHRPASVALGSERTELLPLNSRRLTAAMVRRLASALDIPTTGTAEDVRQLLDAKLTERGHEPMKVQVVVCTGADGVTLCLEDVEGTFLEVRPEKRGSLFSQSRPLSLSQYAPTCQALTQMLGLVFLQSQPCPSPGKVRPLL